ncbi:transglutaminase domain-containing protein [Patescibacteria group bacterium]|nr:transglutaminase domain-containing protein [Patescibacteria group bacterium]MBP9710137.1 transglutaminase domain-containing protein [Patescibacteria group bacterium]
MSWKQPLYWPIHRLKEALRLYPYTKTQTYELTYSVTIHAKEEVAPLEALTLVIPRPPTTKEQQIIDFKLHLPNAQEQRDEPFGNHFFFVRLEPRATRFEIPVFSCKATIHPYKKGSTPNQAFSPATIEKETEHLHPNDPRIQTLAKNIGKSSSAHETARRIHAHLVRTVKYGEPIDELYSDIDALTRSHVDCGGFDSLFVSLCLASGIQARIVSGFFLDREKNNMHAWAEFQDEKARWIPVDPSTEQLTKQGRTKKSGRFGFIGSDRLQLSQGCDIPIKWNNKIYSAPLLQHPFILGGTGSESIRANLNVNIISSQA